MSVSLFWGLVLILIGLSLIIKIVFNIDFPIFKILFAFLFIYIGIKVLVGRNFSLRRPKLILETNTVFGGLQVKK
jgi:predicted membrane protein